MQCSFAFLPVNSVSLGEKWQFCCWKEIPLVLLLIEEMYLNQQTFPAFCANFLSQHLEHSNQERVPGGACLSIFRKILRKFSEQAKVKCLRRCP